MRDVRVMSVVFVFNEDVLGSNVTVRDVIPPDPRISELGCDM